MLVDHFQRKIDYVRISVTDRCDLRCIYCIPQGYKGFKKINNRLTFDEIERIAGILARLGVKHFRLTGGEPLMRKNLPELVKKISCIEGVEDICLTTNGTQLAKYARDLYYAGISGLNVSLDSLRRDRVKKITGGNDSLNRVLNGLQVAQDIGFKNIKINMVPVYNENFEDIEEMLEFCAQNNFTLRLIEMMPLGNAAQQIKSVKLTHIFRKLKNKYHLIPSKKKLGNGPARYWQSLSTNLTIGFITPLSENFCQDCNRVRLSEDGILQLCLGQNNNLPLLSMLRENYTDQEIKKNITQAIKNKPESHHFTERPCLIIHPMSAIGG